MIQISAFYRQSKRVLTIELNDSTFAKRKTKSKRRIFSLRMRKYLKYNESKWPLTLDIKAVQAEII